MASDVNNSKEAIKNRILKYALNYWSIKNIEDLDPAVKLILEALSLELYNLGNEVKDTQVRMLEKIAGLLTPDFLTAPGPAHAVLYATPVEPTEVLNNTTSFVAQSKIASQNEVADTSLDVFFTPVDAVQVLDVQVAHLLSVGNLFSYDPSYNRQVTARAGRGKYPENNTLWLGLRVNAKIDNIQNLALYFDWKNIEPRLGQRTYQLLPLTKWFLNDKELQVTPGKQYVNRSDAADTYEAIFLEYDLLSLIEKDVKQHYDPKFISISDSRFSPIQDFKEEYPAAFKSYFSEIDLQNLKERLVWIKVERHDPDPQPDA